MEKLNLTYAEYVQYQEHFKHKKHPMETTEWDTICSDAARKGSTIFLSDAYKKLPKRYRGEFILRRRELAEGQHRFAIQVSRR